MDQYCICITPIKNTMHFSRHCTLQSIQHCKVLRYIYCAINLQMNSTSHGSLCLAYCGLQHIIEPHISEYNITNLALCKYNTPLALTREYYNTHSYVNIARLVPVNGEQIVSKCEQMLRETSVITRLSGSSPWQHICIRTSK